MYRKIESLCLVTGTNILLRVNYTSETNKPIDKELQLVVTRDGVWGKRKLDESAEKVQTSSYKIRKYYTRDIMYNLINIINTAVHYN